MIGPDWIPHARSSDGELVGWIRPEGEGWVAVSLLGADQTDEVDWLTAEETLEDAGLSWLAGAWMLEREDGEPIRVRIVEFSPDRLRDDVTVEPGRVVVKTDDFGAIDVPYQLFTLPWPPPARLRPMASGEGGSPWG